VEINGQRPADAAGVERTTGGNDRIDFVASSGRYRIVAQNPTKKE
jgi:hypothetical protein